MFLTDFFLICVSQKLECIKFISWFWWKTIKVEDWKTVLKSLCFPNCILKVASNFLIWNCEHLVHKNIQFAILHGHTLKTSNNLLYLDFVYTVSWSLQKFAWETSFLTSYIKIIYSLQVEVYQNQQLVWTH